MKIMVCLASLCCCVQALAQCSNWEAYPQGIEAAKEQHVLYRDALKAKSYEKALSIWQGLVHYVQMPSEAPTRHYKDGIKLYKALAKTTQKDTQKKAYTDSLVQLYEQMATCIGEKAIDYAYKGYHIYALRGDSKLAIKAFEKALELGGDNTPSMVIVPMTQLVCYWYHKKHPEFPQEYVERLYCQLKALAAYNAEYNEEKGAIYAKKWDKAYQEFYRVLHDHSSIWGCDYYILKWQAVYEQDSNSIVTNKKILKSLDKHCDSTSAFYERVKDRIVKLASEVICRWDPNAFEIGRWYEMKARQVLKEKNDSIQYKKERTLAFEAYEKAVEDATIEMSSMDRAGLAYRIAYRYFLQKQPKKARYWCERASYYMPNWGDPYVLLGNMYASSGRLCYDGRSWDQYTLVWIAMDMWEKARAVDPKVKERVNKTIGKYQRYMPTYEDIFQHGLKEGEPYHIGCWIQRKTKVRFSPSNHNK